MKKLQMKIWVLLLLATFVELAISRCLENGEVENDDADKTEIDCPSTNHYEYINCLSKRSKRSTCNNSCNDCDCDSCSSCSDDSCSSCCNSCCEDSCTTKYCCYKTCSSRCSSSSCRSSCTKSCKDTINKKKETETFGRIMQNSSQVSHNITTIINLKNILNNTNEIDIPVVLNNTLYNGISVPQQEIVNQKSEYQPEIINQKTEYLETRQQNCCTVISPKICKPTDKSPFSECFHYRSRQCGEFCNTQTDVVHVEPHKICEAQQQDKPLSCHQVLQYIPQPQPRCYYQNSWPYVNCNNQKPTSCAGCYSHMFSNPNAPNYLQCPQNCYDDGYSHGNFYRKGPIYQPGYSHIPPCMQTGACPFYGGSMGAFVLIPQYIPPTPFGYYNPSPMVGSQENNVDYNKVFVDQNYEKILDPVMTTYNVDPYIDSNVVFERDVTIDATVNSTNLNTTHNSSSSSEE